MAMMYNLCSATYCLRSLATAEGPGSVSNNVGNGNFMSQSAAHVACIKSGYDGLAVLSTRERQDSAIKILDRISVPHWLGGFDRGPTPGGKVHWDNTPLKSSLHDAFDPPWHVLSGQPNDCDGPNSEECIFIGPKGAWFDFACAPKTPQEAIDASENQKAQLRVTAGPEIEWIEGSKRKIEYNVHPLCGMVVKKKARDVPVSGGINSVAEEDMKEEEEMDSVDLDAAASTCSTCIRRMSCEFNIV